MEEYRHDIRVDCEERCILHRGVLHHFATVKNISFGGALVNSKLKPLGLHTGDYCIISVDGEFFDEYFCEVLRVETPDIALKFTGIHKVKAVEH